MPGQFKISINGDQKEEGDFDKLMNSLGPRFEAFAPGYEVGIYRFAKIYFRYEITGVPLHFHMLDNLAKSMKLFMIKYLKNWAYKIEVKFVESG